MDRKEFISQQLDLCGSGLEIGPSHCPVVPKSSGHDVRILDHLNREGLVEKYKSHGVDLGKIESVDFVWSGETYKDLVGETHCFDWILASHVIEHTPDFIRFLEDCDSILKEDGMLFLAVPDKRYCFDHFRPITGVSRLVDSFYENRKCHSPGSIAEYYLNVISKGGKISWEKGHVGDVKFIHGSEEARLSMLTAKDRNESVDIHSWCFVPSSFRLIMMDLYTLGLTRLRESSFFPTRGGEFFLTLSRDGNGPNCSRGFLLESIEREISVQ